MNRSTFTALTGAIAGMLSTKSFAADSPASHGDQRIAMVVYPEMTAIDLIAPQLLFATLGNVYVKLVWKDRTTVVSDTGVPIVPTQTFDEVAAGPTVLFVPGGTGAYSVKRPTSFVCRS